MCFYLCPGSGCNIKKFIYPEVRLKEAGDALFSFYQDWVHHNPGYHMDGGINMDGKWQDRWSKLFFCQPNAMTYGLVNSRNKSVSIFLVELDGIRAQKRNTKLVIVIQYGILQRVRLFTGAKNICAQIDARINSLICGAFAKLVNESYTAAAGYLRKARMT